jgi:Zn finger protein HypA/HybF involved in hydrogenase expression
LIQPADPVTGISSRYIFWILGVFCLVLGGARLIKPVTAWPHLITIWLVTSAAMLRLGLWYMGGKSAGPYFDTMAVSFGLAPHVCVGLVATVLGGAACSSAAILRTVSSRVRTFCPNCGGHLEVHRKALGQQRPCAHCGQSITLRAASESLKIMCYFCQGPIEFPAHALGRKIACPHCRGEITLLLKDSMAIVTEPKTSERHPSTQSAV